MPALRAITRETILFWEYRRVIYKAVLTSIVLIGFVFAWPRSAEWFHRPALPTFVESALLANLAYCAAYVVELMCYFTRYRDRWQRWRTALFVAGVLLASVLAIITVGVIWLGPMSN
jgi:hypothetical protein